MILPFESSPEPLLRPATRDDVDAIATLWCRTWPDGHLGHVPEALRRYRGLVDFRGRVPHKLPETTVATAHGSLAGFVMIREDEVEQVYVARAARGGPTATMLLEHAEERIAGSYQSAWLAVVPGNARARRFYERNGWRDAGAIDYPAQIPGGEMPVPCRRYEKRLEKAR